MTTLDLRWCSSWTNRVCQKVRRKRSSSSCEETEHSAYNQRESHWTVCLSICLSVIFKNLCMLLRAALPSRAFCLSLGLLFPPFSICLPSMRVFCPPCELLVIILLLISFHTSAPYCIPPPACSLSVASFLSLSFSLSLAHSFSLSPGSSKTASAVEPH